MAAQPILAGTEIRIEARGGSRAWKGRRAKLELRAARIALLPPKYRADEPDLTMLADILGHIIQGRYDMVCPPTSAHALAEHWSKAKLRMVDDADHANSAPRIASALKRWMGELREKLSRIGF